MSAVTVGIPFRDEEAYLEGAIRSILGQSFDDFELVLLDDGSTDRSLAIAKSFDDPRIVVLSDGRKKNLATRLNEIARRATSPIVARMDADDVSHPDRLGRQIAVLRDDPDCDAVGSWVGLVTHDRLPFAVVEASEPPITESVALEVGVFPHATMVARRRWLLRNPYDEALDRSEDRDLWCRTAGMTSFRVVREPLYVVNVTVGDADFLAGYVAAQKQTARLTLRYGVHAVGVPRTVWLWSTALAKGVAMRVAIKMKLGERIVRRRGRAPSTEERAMIEAALASGQRA